MLQKGIIIGSWFAGAVAGIAGVVEIASIDEEEDNPTTAIKTAAQGLGNIIILCAIMTIIGLSTTNKK